MIGLKLRGLLGLSIRRTFYRQDFPHLGFSRGALSLKLRHSLSNSKFDLDQVWSDDGGQRAADPERGPKLALEAAGPGLRRHRTRRLRQLIKSFEICVVIDQNLAA